MTSPKLPESSNLPASAETGYSGVNTSTQTPETNIPNAPQSPYRNLILVLGTLVVVGSGWVGWSLLNGQKGNNSAAFSAAMPVKLAQIETATLVLSLEIVGTLEASRSVILRTEISGRISQILVQEGERIQKGQVLLRLDSEDLQAQLLQGKAALERAKARLAELEAGSRSEDIAQARANLKEVQARLTNAQKGSSSEGVDIAKAQLEAARAEAELAKERVKRYRQLAEQGAISQDEFEAYAKEERSASASLQEAERRLAERQKDQVYQVEELEAGKEEAQQNLKRLENGSRPEEIAQARAQVAEQAASVRQTEIRIEKARILAPFTGTVGDIPIKVGDYVSQGSQLTELTENDTLEINLSIPVERALDLRLGLPVEILDSQEKTLTTGKISFISPNVTGNAQIILAKASFSNTNKNLRNNQIVKARVIWDRRPGILVPATAIARLGGETFVFVAETAKTDKPESDAPQLVARQKPVKLGALQGNSYQVLEGLNSGEKIVTTGILNLFDGAAIMPQS